MKKQKPKVKRTIFRKIVNGFSILAILLIVLLLGLIGFSQTQTFRNILRDEIHSAVNGSINGKLNIGEIDGSILTSLYLRDITLTSENDTILKADKIVLRSAPLDLIFKKITLRQLNLTDVHFYMLENEQGEWNISSLTKADTTQTAEEVPADTTGSPFPFSIQVNDLELNDINFTMQTYENLNSEEDYKLVNTDDLRIRSLNMKAKLAVNMEKSVYRLLFNNLSFNPNFKNFNLQKLSGGFDITDKYAAVTNLRVLTDSSDISVSARMDSINLFGGIDIEDFRDYPMQVEIEADPFYFDDLSSFIEATDILKGRPSFYLSAQGYFGGFDINKLVADYNETHLEASGRVEKLNTPQHMYIDVEFTNSKIKYNDVTYLLPRVGIPKFEGLELSDIYIDYEGEPTKFNAFVKGNTPKGSIEVDSYLNLQNAEMEYDVKFNTKNVSLKPFTGVKSNVTSKGKIKGRGVNPERLKADAEFVVTNSAFNGYDVDSLIVDFNADSKIINLDTRALVNDAAANITGSLNFTEPDNPSYSLVGNVDELNLAAFLDDSTYNSSLNFTFSATGTNLDIDTMNADFVVELNNSVYNEYPIDHAELELKLNRDDTSREINLISDFVDFNINGSFSLTKAINLLAYEGSTISTIVAEKLNELNPAEIVNKDQVSAADTLTLPDFVKEDIEFNYDFQFKDFDLIAVLMGNDKLDISGRGEGSVENDSTNFSISTELTLDHFVNIDDSNIVYLSEFEADLNFSRDNRALTFDKLFGLLSVTGTRFYSGIDVRDIEADLTFNQNKLFFNLASLIPDMVRAEAEGNIAMTPVEQEIILDRVLLSYKKVRWRNPKPISMLFAQDRLKLTDFILQSDSSKVIASGELLASGKQDITIETKDVSGEIFSKTVLGAPVTQLNMSIDSQGKITGTFDNPQIDIDINAADVSLQDVNFGSLICRLDYKDRLINTDVKFVDTTYFNIDSIETASPLLTLNGKVPIDLSFTGVEERIVESDQMDLVLKSSGFNINTFGNTLPFVTNQSGFLNADLTVTGTLNDPVLNGDMRLKKGNFDFKQNNLNYDFSVKLILDDKSISIDSLYLSNGKRAKYDGTMRGSGSVQMAGAELESINVEASGNLAILGDASRSANPFFYGDLFIETISPMEFSYENNNSFLNGNIRLKNTNVKYDLEKDNTSAFGGDINYVYVADTTIVDEEEIKFRKLVNEDTDDDEQEQETEEEEEELNFDYNIRVEAQEDTRAVFILGSTAAVSQRLVVFTSGSVRYERQGQTKRAQGSFQLEDGSRLEFYKTFRATGSLQFESDITNPYLDIEATYSPGFYNDNGTQKEVAVKFRINSPLDQLGKRLAENPDNIAVYVGSENIENNTPDGRFSQADAMSFVLLGKPLTGLNVADQRQLTSELGVNTASSFLGPILTNVLNSAVGDVVNDIQLTQSGEYYNFNVSGRLQNVRYTIGGNQEVFNDIGNANLRFEYLFSPQFLLRLERKDPVVKSTGIVEKISELGLKYRFEF